LIDFYYQSHENNIEQIRTILTELNSHAHQLNLRLSFDNFQSEYYRLLELRSHLLGRLRASGYTAWASLHHLLKQCFGRLRSYRALRDQSSDSGAAQTGSLRNQQQQQRNQRNELNSSSANNSLNRHQAASRQLKQSLADLKSHYQVARVQLNRWLALESHILEHYCSLSFRNQQQQAPTSVGTQSTTPTLQAPKVLKFTIRRCEVGGPFVWIVKSK